MSVLDWTDEEGWTDEDSAALDREILASYPHRPPLRPDPNLWELLTPLRSNLVCIDCGNPMGTGNKRDTGMRRHKAGGRCTRCYNRHKFGTTPIPDLRDTGLALTEQGKSAAEIARILGVTERTVVRWRTSHHKGAA